MGGEASTAGAGMLSLGGEFVHQTGWTERARESHRIYEDFCAELTAETGVSIDFRKCGALELAANESEWKELEQKATAQAALGIDSEPASRDEVCRQAPALDPASFTAAFFYPGDWLLSPVEVMAALRRTCEQRGVHLRERTAVRRILPGSGEVILDNELLSAGTVILAAGAWSGGLTEGIPGSRPVKGQLIAYRLPSGSLPVMIRHGHTYALQRSTGFTISGGTMEHVGFDRRVAAETTGRLHQDIRRFLPSLLKDPPAQSWIGFRPLAEGDEPVVRPLEGTRLWLAYGHHRNGILLAPVTARIVAAGILGG